MTLSAEAWLSTISILALYLQYQSIEYRKSRTIGVTIVATVGVEVLLALATGGAGNIARRVGQVAAKSAKVGKLAKIGPFPARAIDEMVDLAKLLNKPALKVEKPPIRVIPEDLSRAKEAPKPKKKDDTFSTKSNKPTPEDIRLAKQDGKTAAHIAAREKVARDYLGNNGFTDGQIANALGDMDEGIDGGVDFSRPVEIISFPPPDTMTQYVKSHGYPGNWFDPLSSQNPDSLGLNGVTRSLKEFKIPQGTGLRSYAKPVLDDWTVPDMPVNTSGGGVQLLVNDTIKKSTVGI